MLSELTSFRSFLKIFVDTLMNLEKQKGKIKNEKVSIPDAETFQSILSMYIKDEDLIRPFNISNLQVSPLIAKEDNAALPDIKKVVRKINQTSILKIQVHKFSEHQTEDRKWK